MSHVIEFREDGWTIMHPTSCRPNLFDCPVTRVASRDVGGPPAAGLGRYYCEIDGPADFVVLERVLGNDLPLDVFDEIRAERGRQDAKWGEQNHPDGTGSVYADAADLARSRCQRAAARGEVTFHHILDEEVCEAYAEPDPAELRAELVQVAAVAVAWIEAIDRRVTS